MRAPRYRRSEELGGRVLPYATAWIADTARQAISIAITIEFWRTRGASNIPSCQHVRVDQHATRASPRPEWQLSSQHHRATETRARPRQPGISNVTGRWLKPLLGSVMRA